MKEYPRERQTEGFEEALSVGNGRGNEGDFILRCLQKEIKEIDRRRNGQYLQVLGGETEILLFLPLLDENHHIEHHPHPATSDDRFFTDWSSIGMGSPLVRTPPQSAPIREGG